MTLIRTVRGGSAVSVNSSDFTDEDRERAESAWQSAESLEELREYTARFIEGRFPYNPTYGADTVDGETEPLVEDLAALNRYGVLTTGSQPGFSGEGFDGNIWKQRAYVHGRATPEKAEQLKTVTLKSEVIAYHVWPHEDAMWFSIPGTKSGGEATLWIGRPPRSQELLVESVRSKALRKELWSLHYIELFDPVWGRTGYLMDQIREIIATD